MIPPDRSRRLFLKTSVALAGITPLIDGLLQAQSGKAAGPLLAYVGTFSSPLRDVLPTQVDLPPGNGRGIHLFQVNRTTGATTPAGIHEMGTSPSCLALNTSGTHLYSANETDRVGENKEGTVSAFAIHRADGKLELLNSVHSGGAGPTYVSVHPSDRKSTRLNSSHVSISYAVFCLKKKTSSALPPRTNRFRACLPVLPVSLARSL